MAHRRKSSHPVCKTRRQQGSNWEPLQQSEDDEEGIGEKSQRSPSQGHEIPVSLETGQDGGPHIMIPPDLYKDFEAVRTQTKLDATDLMRRLLKDYQSISTTSDKPIISHLQHDDNHDNDEEHTTSEKAPIATDVSLATARLDTTDDDEFQGLDLSVRSRKIHSRLFDTKSLETGLDQPLDLTCSKPPVTSESLDRESPSSTQMEGVHNEFNYVYVYPGLYPPGSGLLPHDEMDDDSTKPVTSPVPELISPGRLSPPILTPRSTFMSPTDPLEKNFGLMNPGLAYSNFMNTMAKTALPKSISPTPRTNTSMMGFKQEPGEVFEPQRKMKFSPNTSKTSPSSSHTEGKPSKGKNRNSTEMTVISENMTFPGVYTSVMKLPWSRRTRTKSKKPKHKLKLEDTLIPQFMLDQANREESSAMPVDSEAIRAEIANPASSQSVMMVYPNATSSAYGRPVRRRGRPPKLPMLAKLLQHEQASKRAKKEKKQEGTEPSGETQAQMTQHVQANGGMLVYNSGGQVVTAYAGAPQLPQAQDEPPTSTDPGQLQNITQLPPHMMPNMAQAQFLGQVSLSQLMGGPVQFLGQFPANAVPMPGQTLQGLPMLGQEHVMGGNTESTDVQNPKPDGMPPTSFQYAFQPVFIPSSMQAPVPTPQPSATASETINSGETDTEAIEHVIESPQGSTDGQMVIPELVPQHAMDNPTHVMKHEHSNTISTMSTTSISNTESGAMYQEMILSSKSLVNVKKRKRQTAIQLLKAKSNDQNFLCTSFRIRPRLVAQAQAQRERIAIKESGDGVELGEIDTDSKNLIGPQDDMVHFGENTNSMDDSGEVESVHVKSDFDELYEAYGINSEEIDIKQEVHTDDETGTYLDDDIIALPRFNKRFMLKGSQKRKTKYDRKLLFTDKQGRPRAKTPDPSMDNLDAIFSRDDLPDRPDVGQELFNCKICNTVIPVHQIEEHSLDHVRKNRTAARLKCKSCGGPCEKASRGSNNECKLCRSLRDPLNNGENKVYSTHGHGKIACDECPETFKSLPDFYVHKIDSHKDSDPKALQQGEFECDVCGKVYQYFHALQFHKRTHRERKFPCLEKSCRQRFRSRRDMEAHFDRVHPDKKDYYHCVYEGCSKKFLKNFHLQEHIRVKHYNIKAFQCPWPGCVKEFAAQRHLKIHLLIHSDEKPMKCEHCEYRCRQRSAMNWHMRKHPDVPYKYKRSSKPPSVSAPESE